MLQSFHNFFFNSFDPGGFVSIDKPPLVFWIQTLFASVFGVHGWSVILPQALAGVGSVILLYYLVKPTYGRTAARLASLIMALTPIAVAVSRTNNIDSMLVFTLLVAAWMLFKGVHTQKAAWILGAFAMIGLGFNMKMLQAYLVVPAFYLFYLLAFKVDWKKKLTVLVVATVILVGVSLSWAVIVDSIPQANRPYVGGSKTNSVLELAFNYNGVSRLLGMNGGDGSPGTKDGLRAKDGNMSPGYFTPPNGSGNNTTDDGKRFAPPNGFATPRGSYIYGDNQPGMPGLDGLPDSAAGGFRPGNGPGPDFSTRNSFGRGFGGGGMFGTGQPGPLRLLQSELSGQISWFLPFAILASVGLLAGIRRRKFLTPRENETLFWLAWLVPMVVFFSIAGFFHQYYLIMLAPAIAALSGGGGIALWKMFRDKEGWKQWLLPLALAVSTAFELYILWPYRTQIGQGWIIGIALIGLAALIVLFCAERPKWSRMAAITGVLVLLAAPAYWSATPIVYGDNYVMPQAGPDHKPGFSQKFQPRNDKSDSGINKKLLQYVTKNNTGETYLFATTSSNGANAYIIESGKPVMAMGGFSGQDSILTVEKVKKMVADGKIKFFLISSGERNRGPGGGGSSEVLNWIRENSTRIPDSEWKSSTSETGHFVGFGQSEALYKVNVKS
ncbi:MAG: glycosyltransferase family 39 protein [Chitinophagales bacterium]